MAGHRHRLGDRATRHQAGALGRRQHPRRGADGTVAACALLQHLVDGHANGDPTVDGRARHTDVLRRAPGQPRRCRVGAGRHAAVPAVEHPAVAVGRRPSLAGPARRGRRRRRARPADAHRRPRRGVDRSTPTMPGCSSLSPCRARPPARRATASARRGHRRRPRRLHDPVAVAHPRASTSTATSPPGGGPVCAGPATTRCRSRRSPPSSGPSSPGPTSAATTPSTRAAACCCARRRRSRTRRSRRSTCGCGSSSGEIGTRLTGYPVHAVFEDFTWDKAVTMSGAADDWAYEHLGVYSWTTEFWDPIHAATGTKQSTRLLVPRPDRRAGPGGAALGRRARPRRVRRLVPVRAPPARRRRARRLGRTWGSGRTHRRAG